MDIYLQKNKRTVWNNRIGWKKSWKLISVWDGIIVLGGKFLDNTEFLLNRGKMPVVMRYWQILVIGKLEKMTSSENSTEWEWHKKLLTILYVHIHGFSKIVWYGIIVLGGNLSQN